MSRYTAVSPQDLSEMLAAIGVDSIDDLFQRLIPDSVRLGRDIELPAGRPEQDVYRHLAALAARNISGEDEVSFLGAGMYDSYVPAFIDMLMSRSELLTPYTPYQPEVSQGGLQIMFEYQTAISELTALPVSNASVYEGPSALAAAGYLAKLANGKRRLVISRGVHPHGRETLSTLARGYGVEVVEVPLADGVTDAAAWASEIDDETSAVFFQNPNFLGAVEDAAALAGAVGSSPAVVVGQYDPIALGILVPPGACGVDVAVGEGQQLGNRLDFGGPSFGFFATTHEHIRRIPGRIAGETTDLNGKRGFVLTLQTREQHIRREKATSNICTSQALNALGGVAYLSWLGREGLVELGELLLQRTQYARERLCAVPGISLLHEQPAIREFGVVLDAPVEPVIEFCVDHGVNPGYPLGRDYEEYGDGLLVALTEQRSKADIDRLAELLAAAVEAVGSAEAVA